MIYSLVAGLSFFSRWALSGNRPSQRALLMPMLLFFFVFSAFRYEVGCDWSAYENQYNNLRYVSIEDLLSTGLDPGWSLLFIIQNSVGLPYPWINVLSSLIFFFGIFALIRRQPDPLACLIFLFPILIVNMPMSGIRQASAIGVMCLAFIGFQRSSTSRFVAWTLIAGSFHSSALLFLLLTPLVKGQYSWRRLLFSAGLALPGAFLLYGTSSAQVAMERYVESDLVAAGALFRVGALAITGAYFFLFLRRKWTKRFPEDYRFVVIGSLLMIGTILILPISTVIADRLGYFLIPIQVIIFARLPFFRLRNDRLLHVAFPYVFLLVIFGSWMSFGTHFELCYVPYQTWIFGYPKTSALSAF